MTTSVCFFHIRASVSFDLNLGRAELNLQSVSPIEYVLVKDFQLLFIYLRKCSDLFV